jgi:hypothetical protein
MSAFELFPVVNGLLLGAFLGCLRPRLRFGAGIALSVAIGALATVASGEFEVTWGYLLIDVPLVAASAAAGWTAVYRRRSAAR